MHATRMIRGLGRKFAVIILSGAIMAAAPSLSAQNIDSETLQQLQDLQESGQLSQQQQSRLDRLREEQQQRGQQQQFQRQQAEQDRRMRQAGREAEPLSRLERDYQSRIDPGFRADTERQQTSQQRGQQTSQRRQQTEQDPQQTDRQREPLRQYGYDIFDSVPSPGELTTGRVPDDYVLGVGDEMVFNFVGSTQRTVVKEVDREGRIILPDLKPIPAAGRRFGEFEKDVKARTKAALLGTEVFVSIGSVRMISVYVLGEVANPGVQRMTSLSTPLEALALAGGVKKTGTLRNIRIRRGNEVQSLDLYDILSGQQIMARSLRDGDRIIVPTVGATVAVRGEVNRAGIYELPPGQDSITMGAALDNAGGTLRPRGYAYSVNHVSDSGRQNIRQVSGRGTEIQQSDILRVRLRQNVQVGEVTLRGHVRVPGARSLESAPTVSELIDSADQLQENPYLPFAVVETTSPETQSRVFRDINLQKILNGKTDYTLKDQDTVYVFGLQDIEFLSSTLLRQVILTGEMPDLQASQSENAAEAQQQLLSGQTESQEALERAQTASDSQSRQEQQTARSDRSRSQIQCAGLRRVARLVSDTRSNRFSTAMASIAFETVSDIQKQTTCPSIYDENEYLLPFVLEKVAAVGGTIRRPGAYPITSETSLSTLIGVAGGMLMTTDRTTIEYMAYTPHPDKGISEIDRRTINLVTTKADNVTVSPGSGVRFNQILSQQEQGGVLLTGEFTRPGFYSIRSGETLSNVIERAGGLTEQAYPYGAVFTRESAQEEQQEGFQRAARQIETAMAAAAQSEDANQQTIAAAQATAQRLRNIEVPGRVVIEADPVVLEARPGLDITLEPGDRIHMPKRPSSVTVSGDVLNPGTLQFIPGKSVEEYIDEAGGFQASADDGRVFIVYPNGAAEPVSMSSWDFSGSPSVPPGSTIIVPKDLTPFNFQRFAVDMTQILSQLAVSAASLNTITN